MRPPIKVDTYGVKQGAVPQMENRRIQSFCFLHLYFLDQATEIHVLGK